MKTKSLKRAIIVAFMSVVLCISMLLGTTFAWFTDSATSNGNVIKAGTLDIAFEKWDGDDWVDATTSPIFDYDNWEPGYMQIVNLRVVNKGTLSLKWQATITTENELSALADAINVYVRSDDSQDTVKDYIDSIPDRTQFDALATAGEFKKFTLRQFVNDLTLMTKGTMVAGQESYLGIVLQMDPLAGDEYQDLTLGGEFDLTIVATQLSNETDSFDGFYDIEATYPDATGKVITDTSVANYLITPDVEVEIPAGASVGNYSLHVSNKKTEINEETNETKLHFDITLKKDGEKVTATDTEYTVTIKIKSGALIKEVTHNGVALTDYTYDETTGEITFATKSFSPFTVTYATYNYLVGEQGFDKIGEAVEYLKANGGTLTLYNDVKEGILFANPEAGSNLTVAIDLNGRTIVCDRIAIEVCDGYELTIKDSKNTGVITTTATDPLMSDIWTGAVHIERGGTLIMESGKIASPITAVVLNRYNYGASKFVMNGGTLEIPNRTGGGATLYVMDGEASAEINGGNLLCNKETGGDCWLMYSYGGLIQINDGTFKGPFGGNVNVKKGTFSFGADGDTLNGGLVDAWSYAKTDGDVVNVRPIQATGLAGEGTTENPYLIQSLDELLWFSAYTETCAQDGASQFAYKTIKLTTDIDLAGIDWNPIGSMVKDHGAFNGTFDGDEHTIYNLYVNRDYGAGFFAQASGSGDGPRSTIKNLHFVNADVSSVSASYSYDVPERGGYVGVVAGNAGQNLYMNNVTVKGYVYVEGYGYVGGMIGHGYATFENCVVDVEEGSYVICNYWCGGGLIGYAGDYGTHIKNCSVKGFYVWSAYGAGGAVAGLNNGGNSLENVHAEDVVIQSASDYCMGFVCGNGEENTYTNVTMKNVTSTANGNAITNTDNANITVIE